MGSNWYWLVDGEVVLATDQMRPMQPDEQRRVGSDYLGPNGTAPQVSTVFLGLDHRYGDGPPIVFETMVFWHGHPMDNEYERYETLQQAKDGHARWVAAVKAAMAENARTVARVTVEAGVAIRGFVKRQVIAFCAQHDIECDVQEEKGFLESVYIFTLKGDKAKINGLKEVIERAVADE